MTEQLQHIAVLPQDVANKIAAGEVVERPASVVKELVENALDAEAERISVEVEAGGRQLIRVSDDGCGMRRADVQLAVQRHATSKIHAARDIDAIATLGFRGEALPSIASVSRFEIVSAERGGGQGTQLTIEGGEARAPIDAARAAGTTVTVRNLFYCVPARAKFLKTTATELSHIGRFMHAIALAYPKVGFTYVVDGHTNFDLPPQTAAVADLDALRTRLIQLRGQELVDDLLPVQYSDDTAEVSGYVSHWSRGVLTRQELHLAVNGRPVRCGWLGPVVKRAYGTLLSSDRYPYVFVHLRVSPQVIDVNIHPAKHEVRFGHEYAVQSAVSKAVMAALHDASQGEAVHLQASPDAATAPSEAARHAARIGAPPAPSAPWNTRLTVDQWKKLYGRTDDGPTAPASAPPSDTSAPASSGADRIRAVGQVGDAYVVAEISGVRTGVVLIDQHAAHERINYDAVLRAFETAEAPQQALLLPVTVHLATAQAAIVRERMEDLRVVGFGIEEFGSDAFKIDAVPSYVQVEGLQTLLADVADDFLQTGRSSRVEEVRRRLALALVCRGSVRFNQQLSQVELQALVDRLQATDTPWTCPHGRPTMIVLPFDELEKRFGRRS